MACFVSFGSSPCRKQWVFRSNFWSSWTLGENMTESSAKKLAKGKGIEVGEHADSTNICTMWIGALWFCISSGKCVLFRHLRTCIFFRLTSLCISTCSFMGPLADYFRCFNSIHECSLIVLFLGKTLKAPGFQTPCEDIFGPEKHTYITKLQEVWLEDYRGKSLKVSD